MTMKITKFEHACLVIEKNNQSIVVDPGNFSRDFVAPNNVVVVIITHEHQDHCDPAKITEIFNKNPNCILVSTAGVISKIKDMPTKPANAGQSLQIGDFGLEFFGGKHAEIHSSIPIIDNLGVMIDGLVYYPGDSFAIPDTPVDILALPVAAPWMKISQSIDFLQQVKPRLAFPTHDAILSGDGKSIVDKLLRAASDEAGSTYERIDHLTI